MTLSTFLSGAAVSVSRSLLMTNSESWRCTDEHKRILGETLPRHDWKAFVGSLWTASRELQGRNDDSEREGGTERKTERVLHRLLCFCRLLPFPLCYYRCEPQNWTNNHLRSFFPLLFPEQNRRVFRYDTRQMVLTCSNLTVWVMQQLLNFKNEFCTTVTTQVLHNRRHCYRPGTEKLHKYFEA